MSSGCAARALISAGIRPVVTIAGEQAHAFAVALDDQAIAVVLDLVNPFPPVRDFGPARRDAGLKRNCTHGGVDSWRLGSLRIFYRWRSGSSWAWLQWFDLNSAILRAFCQSSTSCPSARDFACSFAASSSAHTNSTRSTKWPSGPIRYARYSGMAAPLPHFRP